MTYSLELEAKLTAFNNNETAKKPKDYSKLHGSEVTLEEIDNANLAFTDLTTYHRLIKEGQIAAEKKLQDAINRKQG